MTYKILVVDDEPANLRLLERLLRRDYQVFSALSGKEALDILTYHEIALIISDQRMPGMTGIEFLKRAAEMRQHTVRIILTGYTDVNALVDAINSGVVYKYVTKPWINSDLQQTIVRALEHYETNKLQHNLASQNERLTDQLEKLQSGVVNLIADLMINSKDERAQNHARRTSGYAAAIGCLIGIEENELRQLSLAAFFHEFANPNLKERILGGENESIKEERSLSEFYIKQKADVLWKIPNFSEIAAVIRSVHENFDGSGYPDAIGAEQIPLHSRIIAVAAAYDKLTGFSPFQETLSHDEAMSRLNEESGTRFDPVIIKIFGEIDIPGKIRGLIKQSLDKTVVPSSRVFCHTNEKTLPEILQKIKTTPTLAMDVLQAANASHKENPTAQILTAATRLGETKLRNLLDEKGFPVADPELREWSECALRRAIAAQMLAAHTILMNPDDAYALGLLYDAGELILSNLFPEELDELKQLNDEIRHQREIELFGVEQAQITQWMLEECGVPDKLTSAISTRSKLMRSNSPVALLMHIADQISKTEENSIAVIETLGADTLTLLRLSRSDLNRIYERARAICGEIIESQQETNEFVA